METRRLVWMLPALCFAVLVTAVARWGVDIPYWDQWVLVHHLAAWHGGELSFADVWRPHNEHRLVLPQILMLGLARLSGWDIRFELWMNVLLAVALWIVALAFVRRCLGRLPGVWVAVSGASVFGLAQWENWSWGWQIQIFLNVLAVTAGFLVLSQSRWRLPLAAACGVVASFSFGAGLLFWPLALPLLWGDQEGRARRLTTWLFVSSTVIGLYLYGLPEASVAAEVAAETDDPGPLRWAKLYAGYVSVYLGGSVFPWNGRLALFTAPPFALAWLWVAMTTVRRRGLWKEDLERFLPLLLWAGYGVGAAMLTGLGRLPMGIGQALSSRYVTVSQVFWLGLSAIVVGLTTKDLRRHPLTAALFGLLLLSLSYGGLYGARRMQLQHEERSEARRQILAGEPSDEALLVLYPNPQETRWHLSRLKQLGLGPFR